MPGPIHRVVPQEPADPLNIPLGTEVQEFVTKLQGVAMMKAEQMTGNVRYAIQPAGTGEAMPDAHWVDYHTVLIVGPGVSAKASPIRKDAGFKPGNEVKNRVTGMTGIACSIQTHLNGCQQVEILSHPTPRSPEGIVITESAALWEYHGPGLNKAKPKLVTTSTAAAAKPTGGPSTRMARNPARF